MSLTYDDYNKLGFKKIANADQFAAVEPDSELLIENLTRQYYNPAFHSLAGDLASSDVFTAFRAAQYQRAIALQCEFAVAAGASTPYEQQAQALTSVEIGRTTLQQNGSAAVTATYGNAGVVSTAVDVLAHTGLLYRGVHGR